MRNDLKRAFVCAASLMALCAANPAQAGDPSGVWLRESGASRVRIAKCGDAFCGTVVWLKDSSGPAKVGQQVFSGLKPDGENAWKGSAFNPEDGKVYAGKMKLSGDALITQGCALGGLLCKSVSWSRAK